MAFFIPTAATGNSISIATIGKAGELMGFFYPRIDYAQNIREGMPAIRLTDSGTFLWNFSDVWRVAQSMEPQGNVIVTRLVHRDIELTIEFNDVLPAGEAALFRRVTVSKGPNVGKVQFIHYFKLVAGDLATRNGVQAFAEENVVVQHFRDVCLALTASRPFSPQCNTYSRDGVSPTKQSIEHGVFGTSTQAIGRCDFAIGFEPVGEAHWETTLILAGGSTPAKARAAAARLRSMSFDIASQSARERVNGLLAGAGECSVSELSNAYQRAVISLCDLYDDREGTFVAAPEFDPGYELSGGYGYCWPRDAAICALAMQRIGRVEQALRFFEWSKRTQLSNGHWYQRYWVDGSPAPSWCVRDGEIQLDQTCAIIHAAGIFARRLGDRSQTFIEGYRPVVERAVAAILGMVDEKGLHRTAIDLWENSTGSFAYTQAGVIAALKESHEVFGVASDRIGHSFRDKLRDRLLEKFWVSDRRRWLRRITPQGEPDATLDSSVMGLIDPWEVLDINEAKDRALAIETLDGIGQDLRCPVKGGAAVLRFQGESYMGGGPGCVNTLWLAVCRLRLAKTTSEARQRSEQRELAMQELRIALANTNPVGQLPELIPKQWFEYWAAPHAWACSLLIEAVIALRELDAEVSSTEPPAERDRVKRRAPSR